MVPVVESLGAIANVEEVLRKLSRLPHVALLDSALRHSELGRYSFIMADPFRFLTVPADGSDGLASLRQAMAELTAETVPGLPPFQGGAVGMLSYDLKHSLEHIPRNRHDEFALPALAVGLYDVVLAIDHQQEDQAWIISHGFPAQGPAQHGRAVERARWLRGLLDQPAEPTERKRGSPLPAQRLAQQFDVPGPGSLTSDFSQLQYLAAVERVVEYIRAGDAFQVNLSQRLLCRENKDPITLYCHLRRRNPAPFAAYFDLGSAQIVSASPERFVQVVDGKVETRPIKGTRPRLNLPEADLYRGDELAASTKDRAENVMIADLLRNDISRVCVPDSVRVTQLCGVEDYEFVKHLVSVVEGEMRPEYSALDLVRCSFPGGSITGAPKVRAMEIIAELEPTARGAYCGSLGYLGFDGTLDLNILIRTITAAQGWWQIPVGGGIIAQSDPRAEYEETWHKAAGMLKAIE